jgi:hypothetical protein
MSPPVFQNVNSKPRPGSRLVTRWLVVATSVCLLSAGCQRWNWRGDGFGDNTGRFAEKLRPPADERGFSGLDSRAREVERDLGVR